MICKCGGSTITRIHSRKKRTTNDYEYELRFAECTTCKRVGAHLLTINGRQLAKGRDAVAIFEEN
jgi:hypothetical protein